MNKSKAQTILARLLSCAAGLRYGSVSVTLKICEGRIVDVIYAITESMRASPASDKGLIETPSKVGCRLRENELKSKNQRVTAGSNSATEGSGI